MRAEDVYLVSRKLVLPAPSALDSLEHRIGVLPPGYRQFMSTLGVGEYSDFVRVYAPEDVLAERAEHLDYVETHYVEFWGRSLEVLSLEHARASWHIGRTLSGDELIFCPHRPDRIFVLPRHDDVVHWLTSGLGDPLDWVSASGRRDYVYQPPFHYFEPESDRKHVGLFTAGRFAMRPMADEIASRWSRDVVRRIDQRTQVLIFARAVDGLVTLNQSPADHRVGIHISYDSEAEAAVELLVADLCGRGFYEIERHPMR